MKRVSPTPGGSRRRIALDKSLALNTADAALAARRKQFEDRLRLEQTHSEARDALATKNYPTATELAKQLLSRNPEALRRDSDSS